MLGNVVDGVERDAKDSRAVAFHSHALPRAFLLFCVQPMIAKMILPLLGGSPAVWSTCMVFFQAMLLAGYSYAHATTTRLGVRQQTILQAVLVSLPLFVLPFGIPSDAVRSLSPEANPTWWLLGLLVSVVGLPFFVVSSSAPLLQRWFSHSGHPASSDPYSLYGASNLGSMLALLAYPVVIEPNLRLAQQSGAWAVGYGLFAVMTLACVLTIWRARGATTAGSVRSVPTEEWDYLQMGQWLHWVFPCVHPVELDAGPHDVFDHRHRGHPASLGNPMALYLLTFILCSRAGRSFPIRG